MPLKNSIIVLTLLSIALAVTACSGGFTQDEVEATADAGADAAYRSGKTDGMAEGLRAGFQAGSEESKTNRAIMLVETIMQSDNNNALTFLNCSHSSISSPCMKIGWRHNGVYSDKHYKLNSQCVREAKIGYELPDSCR